MQLTEDQIRRIARQEGKKIVNGGGMVIGGGSGSGSSDYAREAQHAKEADHAASADKATEADHAKEADHATKAAGLDDAAQTALDNKYLRKDQDDETEHKLTMGEAEVKGDLTLGPNGTYSISKEGVAKLAGVVAEYLKSSNFRPGTAMGFDGQGYGVTKGTDGKYTLEIDNLIARMKMIVAELEVHEMSFIGGTVVMSSCGNRVDRVEALDAEGSCIAAAYGTQPTLTIPDGKTAERFRCYFLASDGDRQIKNEWTVGQLARAKTNNIAEPGNYTNYQNRDYWRLVVGVSSAPVTKDGKDYHWIDLSNSTSGSIELTDAAGTTWYYGYGGVSRTLNSLPFAGDNIIGMGHGWDKTRQGVAIFSVSFGGWAIYKGINHYDLPDANIVNLFSIKKSLITTDNFILRPYAAPEETQTVAVVRGEYSDTASYGHNDMVTYEGQTWIASGVAIGDTIKGEKPSATSIYWSLAAAKGDDGETPTFAKLRVDHSALHYNPTTQKWDYDSVTVSIVIFTPEGTKTPANGDTTEYYWLLDNDTYHRSSGDGFSATLEVASHTATLYKVGSNVPLDTITVPMVRDGEKGDSSTGAAATVYTIEPCANFEATGKLTDASHVTVSIKGDVQVYKTIGDQKTLCGSGDGVYAEYFRLSIGGTNYDGKNTFTYDGGNIKVSKTIPYEVGKDTNNVPGSATITLYDLISGGTVGNQLASLVVPVSLNPGAIVDVNSELGTIQNTTSSMQNDVDGMQGTIETIKQGQGQISLKVQSLQSMAKSRNLISGGNVTGLYVKKYYVWDSPAFMMEQGKTYTVTACLWMDSATYNNHIKGYVIGADNNWTYSYASEEYTNTSSSIVRFKFNAGATKQMIVRFYERNSAGKDSGNYNGVHIDWLRVDEGDWTGDNGRTIDAWAPSEEEIDAVNMLPDPGFSEAIGYSDGMGERNTFRSYMGDYVSWMSRDSSTDGDGCHGVTFERSGRSDLSNTNPDSYAGMRYIVPFRGAGKYWISFVYTDLSQTLGGASMDDAIYMELHPCDANKNRITGGMLTGGRNTSSSNIGIIRVQNYKTFGETATDSSGNVKKIAYLEVRVYLRGNGSVRVSRLCLSKSDHFIYWNVNEVSEARKKEAAQLATGIDIYSHKIIATTDNFTVRNNSGVTTFSIDKDGNIVGAGNAMFKGAVTATTFTLSSDKFYVDNNGKFKLSTTYFSVDETGKINATGGSISFFNFDNAGMYSGNIEQDGKIWSGLGMSMNNLSVSGINNRRISSVFLGNGLIDSRYTNSNNRTYRVGSTTLGNTFYNYIKLERIGSGYFPNENSPEHAALGIETQGDFCLAALGGPSRFGGMCFASNSGSTFTGDKQHTFYLCSGGTFTMPSDPPDEMLFIVIQTGSRITFNGNGHQFRSGTNYRSTCNSDTVGQWNLFYFDGSYWNTVYINGRPW